MVLVTGGRRVEAQVTVRGEKMVVRIGSREIGLRLEQLGPTTWRIGGDDGAAHLARAVERAGTWWLHLDGEIVAVRLQEAAGARARGARRAEGLEAPMPGAVTQVAVKPGDSVAAGQPIVIIEAMKMEHVIRAPYAGRVVALRVKRGEQVEAGAVVAELQSGIASEDVPEDPAQ
jgi:acetyl-CoA/propionyl-CoA carboxylase biotin carboxyl carrier protein